MRVIIYHINSETFVNFSKGCVNIILSAVSAFQYLWLHFFIFDIVCVNWMYQFYIPFYYCLHEDDNLWLKHVGEFMFRMICDFV
jgi:hypothetical protein